MYQVGLSTDEWRRLEKEGLISGNDAIAIVVTKRELYDIGDFALDYVSDWEGVSIQGVIEKVFRARAMVKATTEIVMNTQASEEVTSGQGGID